MNGWMDGWMDEGGWRGRLWFQGAWEPACGRATCASDGRTQHADRWRPMAKSTRVGASPVVAAAAAAATAAVSAAAVEPFWVLL